MVCVGASINLENHDNDIAATKKIDSELKHARTTATTAYDKKQKCVELEKVEREKALHTSHITTNRAICGVVAGFDASLVIKVGDFENDSADQSARKMSHGGEGFLLRKRLRTVSLLYL
jgi:hypothetical protein